MNKLDAVNATITITLEENDYKDKVKKVLRDINNNRPEPGFRPGHVPAALIQKKYGKAAKTDVLNKEVADAIYDYIEKNKLQVLGNPVPEADPDFSLDQKDYTFNFKLGLAPEIDPHVDKEMHIPYYTIEVTDEMIEKQDAALRRRYGKQEPGDTVDDTALVKGVITELDSEGKPLEGGIVVENGILSPEYFVSDEQKALFMGKHTGDVVTFNPWETCKGHEAELSSMLGIPKEDIANHKGDFTMDIKEIIVLKPAEDGVEFFEAAFGKDNVHDAEEYKKAIKDLIASQLANDSNFRFTIDGKEAILKAVGDVELPDAILKDYLKMRNEALTDENIDEEYNNSRPDLVWQLTRDAIARKLEVKVTPEDMKNYAKQIAASQLAQYGMSGLPESVLDKYAENMLADEKTRARIAEQVFDAVMWAGVKNAVSVEDKTVSVEEFNKLFSAE